jgi:Rrf2 family protein
VLWSLYFLFSDIWAYGSSHPLGYLLARKYEVAAEAATGKGVPLVGLTRIPRRVDYGLRTVIYLLVQDQRKCCAITEIAQHHGVPKKFLQKIIQDLMRCSLIKSKRGACGGYTLARSPEQISFYDVIEAIEGGTAHRNQRLGCRKQIVR